VGSIGKQTGILTNHGQVYVFEHDGSEWIETGILTNIATDDMSADHYHGRSVDLDGDYIIAGAYQDDTIGTDYGSVSIWKKN
jgi:hypothetical protein